MGIKIALLCNILGQRLDKCSRDKNDSHSSSLDPPVSRVHTGVVNIMTPILQSGGQVLPTSNG